VSRIPSDVDNTIWQIAERGDHQAAQDFSDKFPALAQAMNDRMRMVSGMKGSAARRSRQANATHSAADAAKRPTMVGEVHG